MIKGLKTLLTGLAAGIGLGVLFAPKKGDELRKEIKSEVQKGGSGLKTISSNLKEMGDEIGDTTKKTYKKISKSKVVKKAGAELKKAYQKHVPEETKNKINKTVKDAKSKLATKKDKK